MVSSHLAAKSFKLPNNFIEKYKNIEPPFGFNGLGLLAYLRTYSRLKCKKCGSYYIDCKEDKINFCADCGSSDIRNEKWFETIRRVVEGTYSIQKNHIQSYNLGWDEDKALESAQEMYDRMFYMKFLPPGRGLWVMGTRILEERGLFASLNNCGLVSTENIDKEVAKPFEFLMDMSMLGVGVGFDIKGAGKLKIYKPNSANPQTYIIPDTREGWIESLKLILDSYLRSYKREIIFNYSEIRSEGLLIKTFGGKSCGPTPLKHLHEQIKEIFTGREGELITITDIVNIMNMIGVCVVAGNIRRTAEIVFGPPENEEYLKLKDYSWNAEKGEYEGSMKHRAEYGWTSNNSIFAELGMDYSKIAHQIKTNGEPGFLWLDNVKAYSKMNGKPDYKDKKSTGSNPSLRKGTRILTTEGIFPIEDLENKEFEIINQEGKIAKAKCFLSGKNKQLIKVNLLGNHSYYATKEHEWPILNLSTLKYEKRKTIDLKKGDKLPILKINNLSLKEKRGTYNEGFFIGYWLGDGWFSKDNLGNKQIGIIINKDEYINGTKDILEEILKQNNCTSIFKRANITKNETYEINTTHREVIKFIESFGFYNKKEGLSKEFWENTNEEFKKGFVNGLFTADGHISKNNDRICLSSISYKLIEDLADLFGFYGIKTSIIKNKQDITINTNNKIYNYKDHISYFLNINDNQSQIHFYKLFKLQNKEKQERLNKIINLKSRMPISYNNIKILSTEETDLYEDVWDITVYDNTHTFKLGHCITGNCVEQSLEPYELCCLVETFPTNNVDLEDFKRTLKFAYLYAKTVTLGQTHWHETNKVLLRNRRIGTSMSGIAMFLEKNGIHKLKEWCEEGFAYLENCDTIYSDWLTIPKSIKKTSIKPSGTVSLIPGVTPGMHYPESNYYIRRMRIAKNSDLLPAIKEAGYKLEKAILGKNDIGENIYSKDTLVIEIPIALEGMRTLKEVSAWEQISLAAFLQRYWSDNQVSCTITFQPEEKEQIKHMLNYFQYQLKGISFLPKLELEKFAQMPYEAISKDTYKERIKKIKPLNFNEIDLMEDGIGEKGCNNDSCELKI